MPPGVVSGGALASAACVVASLGWSPVGLSTASSLVAACVGDEAAVQPPSGDGGGTPSEDGGQPGVDGGGDSAATPGSASPGDAGSDAAFEVTSLPGLRLWLESTKDLTKAAVGNDVVSWRDSSGKWADGGAGAPDGGAHMAIPVPYGGGGAVYPTVAARGIAGRAMGAPPNCTSSEYTPSTTAHVFVSRRKASQAIFRVDGTSRATYDYAATNPDLGVLTFQQPSAFVGGGIVAELAELLVIIGPTSDASLDRLEGHLKTKYAIP